MASTIVEPIGPFNELDKEILDFWKLKNRYDHIYQFISQFNEYCQELIGKPVSELPPLKQEEPSIAIDTAVPQEQSITLDASSDSLNRSEALVISPGNDILQFDTIDSPGPEIVACQSPSEEADTVSLILSTPLSKVDESEKSETDENGKLDISPTPPVDESPILDLDAPPNPTINESPILDLDDEEVEESYWKITRKQKQFYCRLISQQGDTIIVKEEKGPFPDLIKAREAIGMAD